MQFWFQFLLHLVLEQDLVLLLALTLQLIELDLGQVFIVHGHEVLLALVLILQLSGLVQSVVVASLLRLVLFSILKILRCGHSEEALSVETEVVLFVQFLKVLMGRSSHVRGCEHFAAISRALSQHFVKDNFTVILWGIWIDKSIQVPVLFSPLHSVIREPKAFWIH